MRRLSLRSYGLPDVLFKIMLNAPMPLGIETTLTGCAREKNYMLKKCGINIKALPPTNSPTSYHRFGQDLSYKQFLHCCVAIGKISIDTTHRAVLRRQLSFLLLYDHKRWPMTCPSNFVVKENERSKIQAKRHSLLKVLFEHTDTDTHRTDCTACTWTTRKIGIITFNIKNLETIGAPAYRPVLNISLFQKDVIQRMAIWSLLRGAKPRDNKLISGRCV